MFDSFMIPQTVAHQTPLPMGFPRQEYWSGLPFPSLGDLPNPGIKPTSPALASRFFTTEQPGKPFFPELNDKLFEHKQLARLSIPNNTDYTALHITAIST